MYAYLKVKSYNLSPREYYYGNYLSMKRVPAECIVTITCSNVWCAISLIPTVV